MSVQRSPFETYLLIACVIAGVGGVIDPMRGSSAALKVMPLWELYGWYSGLVVGGTIALFGVFRRSLISFYIERTGLLLLVGLCALYSLSIILAGGVTLALAALIVVFFAIACVVRVRQIDDEIRLIRGAMS